MREARGQPPKPNGCALALGRVQLPPPTGGARLRRLASFSVNETLYDFIAELLKPSFPAAIGDLFAPADSLETEPANG